jgi:hypothetical protein
MTILTGYFLDPILASLQFNLPPASPASSEEKCGACPLLKALRLPTGWHAKDIANPKQFTNPSTLFLHHIAMYTVLLAGGIAP